MSRTNTNIKNTLTIRECQSIKRYAPLFMKRFGITDRLLVSSGFVAELQIAHPIGSLTLDAIQY